MELKDFVRETLTQIAQGIQESLEPVREAGGYSNPAIRTQPKTTDSSHFASMGAGRNVFLVDFDVAVSVSEEAGSNAEAKLKVASFLSLGAGGDSSKQSSATNRISFKVPLALPVDPITEEELKSREAEAAKKSRERLQRVGRQNSSWTR